MSPVSCKHRSTPWQYASRQPPRHVTVDAGNEGQRIDNFLHARLKGVPRARIYRSLRRGEVRVNKGRVRQGYRLSIGDIVRIPPLAYAAGEHAPQPHGRPFERLMERVIYEDGAVLVLDKPAGLAVHGGSGVAFGIIEALRGVCANAPYLELVHRLDRETSGCLLIAKQRAALRRLHESLRSRSLGKEYLALVRGRWRSGARGVSAQLRRDVRRSGERVVRVAAEGKPAKTVFRPLDVAAVASLLAAHTRSGRTHQIRVHAASIGHPLAGDDKYGDADFNHTLRRLGLQRLFLHAHSITFPNPANGGELTVTAPLPPALRGVLDALGLSGPG